MNIDQLTNKEDYSIPNTPDINIIELSSEDASLKESSVAPSAPVKKPTVKQQKKIKRVLYNYRKDPRYKGQPLEFEIHLNQEEGTLVNFSELVKNYLDEQEARKKELGEVTESDSQLSEALVSGSHSEDESSGDSSENLEDSATTLDEEEIQDDLLKGFLKRANAYNYGTGSEGDVSDIGEYDYHDYFIDDSELLNAPKKKNNRKSKAKVGGKLQSEQLSQSEDEPNFNEFGKDPRGISRFFVHYGPLPSTSDGKTEPPKPKTRPKPSVGPRLSKKQSTLGAPGSSLLVPHNPIKKTPTKKVPKKELPLNPTKSTNLLKQTTQARKEIDINNFTSEDSELGPSSSTSASDLEQASNIRTTSSLQPNGSRPILNSPNHREHIHARPPLKFQPKSNEKPVGKNLTSLKPFTSKFSLNPPKSSAKATRSPPNVREVSDGPLKKILNSPTSPLRPILTLKPISKRRKLLTPNVKAARQQREWYRNLPIPPSLEVGPESHEFAPELERLFLDLKHTIKIDMVPYGAVPVTVKTITLDLIRVHLRFNLTSSGNPPINFIQRLSFIYGQDRLYILKLISKMFLADQLAQRIKEKEEEMESLKQAIIEKTSKPTSESKKFIWDTKMREQVCRLAQLEKAIYHLTIKKLSAEGKNDVSLSEESCLTKVCSEIFQLFPEAYNVSIKRIITNNMDNLEPLEPDFSLEKFFLDRPKQTLDRASTSHDPIRTISYKEPQTISPSQDSTRLPSINLPDSSLM
ncbi:hypothetical protein DSO57_1016653 [Entomophthora muscae]|uniref:Uncharacterized protein n=1 Tax=Entomophthora muscae TaxID=34485 RepID=A0ACC2STJ5_9FUNG|nr:hypothetical protein DSO57_1016653 [Entomophthora muscae]